MSAPRRLDVDGEHVYVLDNIYYPSATAVVSEVWPYNGPPGAGAEAARVGSVVHEIMAEQCRGREYNPGCWREAWNVDRNLVDAHARRLVPYTDMIESVLGVEEAVVSTTLGVGGTADLVCHRRNELTVIDWKTKSAEPDEHALNMHHLQAAIYATAWNDMHGELPGMTAVICSWPGGTTESVRPYADTARDLFSEPVIAAIARARAKLPPVR